MKPSVLSLLVLCVACRGPESEPTETTKSNLIGPPAPADEGTALNSILDENKFYVSVEIVFHAKQAMKYPQTNIALAMALEEWRSHLPVRLSVMVEDPSPVAAVFGFTSYSYLNRYGIIEILMDDIQAPPYNQPFGVLGLWMPNENRILLDADTLEQDPQMAYSTALHELGHMFGLPHFVGMEEPVYSGHIVLPADVDAQAYVMYPQQVTGKPQTVLSEIEIELARHMVLHFWSGGRKIDACYLTKTGLTDKIHEEDSSHEVSFRH